MDYFHKGQKYQYLINIYSASCQVDDVISYVNKLDQQKIEEEVIKFKPDQKLRYNFRDIFLEKTFINTNSLIKKIKLYNPKFNTKNFKNSKYKDEIISLLLINNRLNYNLPPEMLLTIFNFFIEFKNDFYLGRCYQLLIDLGKNMDNIKNLKKSAERFWYNIVRKGREPRTGSFSFDSPCFCDDYTVGDYTCYCGKCICFISDSECGVLPLDDTFIEFHVEYIEKIK